MRSFLRFPPKQRGVALVLVLWVSLALTLIGTVMSSSLQREIRATSDLIEAAQSRQAARAGISRGMAHLRNLDAGEIEPFAIAGAAGQWQRFVFQGFQVHYRVVSEMGRIDINRVDRDLLRGLLTAVGVDDPLWADSLTDNILDWRDSSTETRLQGTPPEAYVRLGLPEGRRDGLFESIEELQQVAGIDAEIYRRIVPYVTVHTYARRPSPSHAAVTVLAAHPDASIEFARSWANEREAIVRAGGGPLPAFPGGARGGIHGVWAVEAIARSADRTLAHIEAVVLPVNDEHRPVLVLEWREPPLWPPTLDGL